MQGPFHGVHEDCPNGANICLDGSDKPGGDATPALVTGRVLDCVTGAPIPGAKVDVWLTAVDGQYAVQRVGEKGVDPRNLSGVFHSDDAGGFSFKCIRPTVYKASRTTLAGILAAPSKDSSDNHASIADRCRRTGRGASCSSTARGMRGGRHTYTSSSARRGMRRSQPTSSAG